MVLYRAHKLSGATIDAIVSEYGDIIEYEYD